MVKTSAIVIVKSRLWIGFYCIVREFIDCSWSLSPRLCMGDFTWGNWTR